MPPKLQRIREWIATSAGISPDDISADTPLVEERVLTSIMILDLLGVIEEVAGQPVDPDAIRASAFHDLGSIGSNFLGVHPSGHGVLS
jgi:acyl carrier protein